MRVGGRLLFDDRGLLEDHGLIDPTLDLCTENAILALRDRDVDDPDREFHLDVEFRRGVGGPLEIGDLSVVLFGDRRERDPPVGL